VAGLFATGAAALASVNAAIGLAQSFGAGATLGIPSALAGFQNAVGVMLGGVLGGIGGPVLSGVNGALAIGGSVSASTTANLAAMLSCLGQGRAILAPVLAFTDTALSAVPVLGAVVAGTAPAVNAAGLTNVATLTAALPTLRRLDAALGTMQQIVGRAG
jgi:hypothetical protein